MVGIIIKPTNGISWWADLGFACAPEQKISRGTGFTVYRAWGGASTEWGTGYFSLEKPESVLDAELRFNIADWGNQIHFVSSFRIANGAPYLIGRVAHGVRDLSRKGTQVYVEPKWRSLVRLVTSKEILRHDVFVSSRIGSA
jgi:hypothetical protein